MDWPVENEKQGRADAAKVVVKMEKEHGSDLRWVDLERKAEEAGEWELVHRFPYYRPSG